MESNTHISFSKPMGGLKLTYEYLLILPIIEWVSSEVLKIKYLFEQQYGCRKAANSEPHITLINFIQLVTMENHIVQRLERFSRSVVPFVVKLNGFGNVPSSVIYINVVNKAPIVEIVKNMKGPFKHLLTPDKKLGPKFAQNPHVTIAREMSTEQYDQALLEWKNKEFAFSFPVNEMILLKREIPSGKCYTVKHFLFGGSNNQGIQSTLPF